MRETKKIKAKIQKWIDSNGACDIDIKEENIMLYNGGLFQECNEGFAELWVGDLDSTIRYLQRLKYFLNKTGFNTRRDIDDFILDEKVAKRSKRE